MNLSKSEPFVLIESDWNLKVIICCNPSRRYQVLIESDWNLKDGATLTLGENRKLVLIESDWNLKSADFLL